jgi:putative oxidoreductase
MSIDTRWILALVRAVLGIVMTHYGWPKVRNLKSNANDFVQMGFKPGMFWGTLIAAVEFFGGLAILLGLDAELAATLFGFQMMVGFAWKLKTRKPFSDYSYDIQLFALCLVVMSQGPGALAIQTFRGSIFLRWDVAVASVVAAALLAVFSRPASGTSQQPARATV